MSTLGQQVAEFHTLQEHVLQSRGFKKSFVKKKAQWGIDGRQFVKPFVPVRQAGASVQVDPTLVSRVVSMIEQVAPALADAYNRHLLKVAQFAFAEWPVATGLSKSLLALEFSTDGRGRFEGRLVNRAPYAWYIKSPKSVVQELIFKPGRVAADRIERDTAEALTR